MTQKKINNDTKKINVFNGNNHKQPHNISIFIDSSHPDELIIDSNHFNEIYANDLPINLEELYINCGYFNKPLDNLPENLKILSFIEGSLFNFPLKNLPTTLCELVLGYEFNHPLDYLPENLKILSIYSRKFNYMIDNLPNSLFELNLCEYNKPIDNLPFNLKILNVGTKFNQSVNYLPPNLITIIFGMYFNQTLDNLPNSVRRIIFYQNMGKYDFNYKINKLPSNLSEFHFYCMFILTDNDDNIERNYYYYPINKITEKSNDKIKYVNQLIANYHTQPKKNEKYI